jgi:hypothetical protein
VISLYFFYIINIILNPTAGKAARGRGQGQPGQQQRARAERGADEARSQGGRARVSIGQLAFPVRLERKGRLRSTASDNQRQAGGRFLALSLTRHETSEIFKTKKIGIFFLDFFWQQQEFSRDSEIYPPRAANHTAPPRALTIFFLHFGS